jgi:hypothetical protein
MTLYLNLCPISSRGKELLDGKFITFRCVYIDRMPSAVKRIMTLVEQTQGQSQAALRGTSPIPIVKRMQFWKYV